MWPREKLHLLTHKKQVQAAEKVKFAQRRYVIDDDFNAQR
jgi:hypothetical protein